MYLLCTQEIAPLSYKFFYSIGKNRDSIDFHILGCHGLFILNCSKFRFYVVKESLSYCTSQRKGVPDRTIFARLSSRQKKMVSCHFSVVEAPAKTEFIFSVCVAFFPDSTANANEKLENLVSIRQSVLSFCSVQNFSKRRKKIDDLC